MVGFLFDVLYDDIISLYVRVAFKPNLMISLMWLVYLEYQKLHKMNYTYFLLSISQTMLSSSMNAMLTLSKIKDNITEKNVPI